MITSHILLAEMSYREFLLLENSLHFVWMVLIYCFTMHCIALHFYSIISYCIFFNEYNFWIDCITVRRYVILHINNLKGKPTRKVGDGVGLL